MRGSTTRDPRRSIAILAVAVAVVAIGCGGSGLPSASPSAPASPVHSAAATPSPSLAPTIPPSMAAVTAAAGFETWLSQPDLEYVLGFDGTDAGVVPVHGMIHVDGPDSFQLLGAESGAVFVYERSSLGETATRSVGTAYQPEPAKLTDEERFGQELAAARGWSEIGTDVLDGQTLHHLTPSSSAISEIGLIIDTLPPDAPAELRAGQVGRIDAWVTADGQPVSFTYRSSSLQLDLYADPVLESIAADTGLLARHEAKAFGYSLMAPGSTTYEGAETGETWQMGSIAFLTYCKPVKASATLDDWAGDGLGFYE